MKNGYVGNVEQLSIGNSYFRKVIYTAQHSQLVLMSLAPGRGEKPPWAGEITNWLVCKMP